MNDVFTKITMAIALLSIPVLAFAYGFRPGDGVKTLTLANTTYQINSSDVPYHSVSICASPTNTGTVSIGGSTVATDSGIILQAGKCKGYFESENAWNGNLNRHYANSTVAGNKVNYEYTYPVPTRAPGN